MKPETKASGVDGKHPGSQIDVVESALEVIERDSKSCFIFLCPARARGCRAGDQLLDCLSLLPLGSGYHGQGLACPRGSCHLDWSSGDVRTAMGAEGRQTETRGPQAGWQVTGGRGPPILWTGKQLENQVQLQD